MNFIIRTEFLYHCKKVYTLLFFLLLIFQGVWYMIGVNDLFANNSIHLNASAIIYRNMAVMGIILFAITAIISASALARDLETGAANIIYPAIIHEKKYFLGKYIGVMLVNFAVVLGYPIGILLFPFLGTGTPDQFGPVPIGQMVHGFILLTAPNLIFLVTFAVFLVVMTRRATAAYLGILVVCILFLLSTSARKDSLYPLAIELLDPFGYCSVESLTETMGVQELNNAYLPVTSTLLFNRLIWGMVSLLLFAVALLKFNFKAFAVRFVKKSSQETAFTKPALRAKPSAPLALNHSFSFNLLKSLQLSAENWKNTLSSPPFLSIMATLFLMFLGYNFFWTSAYYLTASHLPLTSVMTYIRIPMMIVIGIMLLILSGELLFKDRTSSVWQITDAMPTPTWVFVLSRFLTMAGIAFLIVTLIFVAGVLSQWAMGFKDMEWGLYLRELYGSRFGWLTCLHLISLAFFCGVLFNSRLKGHIISIALFIFISMSVDFRLIEQLRFGFPFVPGVFGPEKYNYSEMNGYGVLDAGLFWYTGAWTSLSVLFLTLSLLLWNRGVDRTVKERLHILLQTLRKPGGRILAVVSACCLLLFGYFQYGIHDNLIRQAEYQTDAQKEAEAAAYEKDYSVYRETPQPKIIDMDLVLNLFPKKRKANYQTRLVLKNITARTIDTLHVDWDKKLTVEKLAIEGRTLEKTQDDTNLRHAIYRLHPALRPGEELCLTIEARLAYKGFHQSDFQSDLTYNGTVLGTDFLPFFGYDRSRELTNNRKRLGQGLSLRDSRMSGADNAFSRANRFESLQSDGLTWNMVVSTDADQRIIGPGEEIKTWRDQGRNYAQYTSQRPGAMDFKIISAKFATREFICQGVTCQLFHIPRHTYNLAVFQDAMKKAIPWLTARLGPYPHSHALVIEKPFYDDEFLSFVNVAAISENRGWTADIKEKEDGQYIHLIVAEQLARQWILASLKVADVQGAQLLTESIARYYAFRFMDEMWGPDQTSKWLNQAYDDYEKGRGEEGIVEKPLLLVDKASYISRHKGGLALYALAQQIGPKFFDHWLAGWVAQAAQEKDFLTSAVFYEALKEVLPSGLFPFARDWLEKRVQYSLSLIHTQVENQRIALTVQATKQEHDNKSNIQTVPFSTSLEVGFINDAGEMKEIKRIMLKAGEHVYGLDCSFIPKAVILDPHHWYLVESRQSCFRKL